MPNGHVARCIVEQENKQVTCLWPHWLEAYVSD